MSGSDQKCLDHVRDVPWSREELASVMFDTVSARVRSRRSAMQVSIAELLLAVCSGQFPIECKLRVGK